MVKACSRCHYFKCRCDISPHERIIKKRIQLEIMCKQLKAENDRLKKALKKYGRCWSGCDSRAVLVESEGKGKGWYAADCTCGFDKALKGK